MAGIFRYLVLAILYLNTVEAARILGVFSVPSISHQLVFRHLTKELVKRGHEMVVVTTDPAFPKGKAPANLTEIDVHDISYKLWRENFISTPKGHSENFIYEMEGSYKLFSEIFYQQLQQSEVQNLINDKKQKFDLLLLEAIVRPTLVFSHVYKAPTIFISSFDAPPGSYGIIGADEHPVLYPSCLRQRLHNLSLWEKLKELYHHYLVLNYYNKNAQFENKLLRKVFGAEVPSVTELEKNVDMLFANVNPVFQGIRPVPPSVVYMGGLHQNPPKSLPKDLQSYLDASQHDVIYFSLGTNVNTTTLPLDKIKILVEVFSKLPQNVIMKWNTDDLPGKSDNIKLHKWLPQSDVLRHPKVKLFITQAGLQSTDEAITAGVPLIGIPMLADQWRNAEKYLDHEIGLKLDFETLSKDDLMEAIKTILNNDSYRKNIIKLRELMNDQPQSPMERAVWWTEHVLRHGGAKHLRSPAANVSWAEYFEIEIMLIFLFAFVTITALVMFLLRIICNRFVNTKVKLN